MGYIMKKNSLSNPRVQNTLGAFIDYPSLLLTPRSVVGVPNGPLLESITLQLYSVALK